MKRRGNQGVNARVASLALGFEASGYDAYGISREALTRAFRVLEPLYRRYFRVRVHDIERVPTEGRAMLDANHSGGVGIDAALVIGACFFELDPPRLAQGMADRFLNRLPLASLVMSRTGQLTGLPQAPKLPPLVTLARVPCSQRSCTSLAAVSSPSPWGASIFITAPVA